MRFTAGFFTGLLFRPLVRLVCFAVAAFAVVAIGKTALDRAAPALAGDRAALVRAVDGDTVIARLGGRQERVRVLGIDTPETVKPGTAVQRCGPEASARAKAWVTAHPTAKLVRDFASPDRDRYGRLLRYVQPTEGGRDLSTVQVAAGLARVAAYGQQLSELGELRAASRRAKTAGRGLWGATGCAT